MADDGQAFAAAVAIAVSGYVMWRRYMRAANLMEGTATARVATAAKGYVELVGTARAAGVAPVRDPIQMQECLWFHVVTEKRGSFKNNSRWRVEKSVASTELLALQDETGFCLIVPGEAKISEEQEPEVIVKESSSRRHKIWRIRNGDPLYALGFLSRRSPPLAGPAPGSIAYAHAEVELLRVWKRDQADLHKRFDTNNDGRIDAAEWERARLAAREAVAADAAEAADRSRQAAAAAPDAHITHELRRPEDGRPLLVTSEHEEKLTKRVKRRSRIGLAMFVGGTLYILFALSRCVA